MLDLWGPLETFYPGHSRQTRFSQAKPYHCYLMVFVCCATGTTNIQIIEGKHTNSCLQGITKFLCETTVPKVFLIDEDGGLVKNIKDREIGYTDLQGQLFKKKSIHFKTV